MTTIRINATVSFPPIDTPARLGENGVGKWAEMPWRAAAKKPRNTSAIGGAMNLHSSLRVLLVLTLGLPVVQAVLIWVVGMLAAMGDAAGAAVVRNVGTACHIAWSIALVALVIVLTIRALNEPPHNAPMEE